MGKKGTLLYYSQMQNLNKFCSIGSYIRKNYNTMVAADMTFISSPSLSKVNNDDTWL